MVKEILVGQRVRINEKYAHVAGGLSQVGTGFTVTGVERGNPPRGHKSSLIVKGDPNGWGVWGDYVDVVPTKMHGSTVIESTLGTSDRIVRVGSGRLFLSLSVSPKSNPAGLDNVDGITALTVEQAEKIASDLLARVSEIKATR